MKPSEILEKGYRGLLYEYLLESAAMILGERFKGGVFRPSSKVLRYSQITGALRAELGIQDIHAAGIIERFNVDFFVYSPQDKVAGRSKVPLIAEVLTDVRARVYIASPRDLPEELSLRIGALVTKGFGESHLKLIRVIEVSELKESIERVNKTSSLPELATRLPLREEIYKGIFGVSKIIKPIYCYMFYPTSPTSGYYELSLKEGSIVLAPSILIRKPGEIHYMGSGMSSIDSLVEGIIQITRKKQLGYIRFTSKELNDLAEIYERYGFTVAEIHLRRKMGRARNEQEQYKLRVLLEFLNLIESSRIPRQMGAYIIKNLNVITRMRRRY